MSVHLHPYKTLQGHMQLIEGVVMPLHSTIIDAGKQSSIFFKANKNDKMLTQDDIYMSDKAILFMPLAVYDFYYK